MGFEIKPGADGLYAVCFKNYKVYSEQKIREVFGRYGRVVSVRFCGADNAGMVFVRYREYDETKNCLEDLKKTNELSVKMALCTKPQPHGPKQQSGDMFKPSARHKVSDGNSNANHQNSGSNYGGLKNNFKVNFKQSNGQKRKFFQPKPENNHPKNENPSMNHEKPEQNDEQNVTENGVPKVEEPLRGEILNGHSEHGSDNTAHGATRRKANIKHPGNEDNLKNLDNRDQLLQSSETNNDDTDDGPPPLAGFEDFPDLVGERPKVYAKDVIVANLPPTVDVSDIIRLARRLALNPVHVSPIEKTGIRYNIPFCHLWMENDYEAKILESELRGTCMEGKKLLVVRAEKLLNGII